VILLVGAALAQPVELTLWHAYRGAERAAVDALVDRYEAEHADVAITPLALPSESISSKLEAAIPRGNGPELFIGPHERVGAWGPRGLMAAAEHDAGTFHPATVEALTYRGVRYGYPLAFKAVALFWNKDLLAEPPATTDELLAVAGELTRDGRYGLAYESASAYYFGALLHGYGGGVFDGEAVSLDRPENAAALSFARGVQEAGLLPEEPTGALVSQLFNEGGAAMVFNGPWFLGEIDGVDFGIAPLPVVSETGLPAAPYLTVEGIFVSGEAEHPAEASAFARWLAGPEAALVRAREGRQPVAALAAYDSLEGDEVLAAFRRVLDTSVPMPNQPEMAATWEPLARALRAAMRGSVTPEVAMRSAQFEVDVALRPPPPEANPVPWIAAAALGLFGLLAWIGLGVRRAGGVAGLRGWGHAYAYAAPASIAMGLLVVAPFLVGAGVAFFTHHQGTFTFVGLANFLDILLARDFSPSHPLSFYFTLLVTLLWTVANVVLHVTLGVALALLLREPWVQLRGVYRVLLIVPWAVPSYITALIWKGMFHRQFGAVNALLSALGLEPVSWFAQFSTAFAANLATNTWLGFPFMMVVTLGALQAIPRDLEQAAEVDGANAVQRFVHVTLPLLKPALLPAVVLGSVWTFNNFNIIYLVSGGEPDGSTEILISEAYRWAFTRGHRYGYAAAYAVLIFGVLVGWGQATKTMLGRKVI